MKTRLGLKGTALNWFQSFLSDRTQNVYINGTLSDICYLLFGVPRGSVLWPILFTIDIARRHGITFHIYSDDTQVYCSFDLDNADNARQQLENCISDIRVWMISHKLKLNDDKTEVIVLSAPRHKQYTTCENISIGNTPTLPAASVRNLGVILDQHITMETHIKMVCKNVYYHLRNIASIRNVLTTDSAKALVHAFITSRLDYYNSLLCGLPDQSIWRLQLVQNRAARMITGAKMRDHITPILHQLHWLPVHQRIVFKVLVLTFKSLHGMAPYYLHNCYRRTNHNGHFGQQIRTYWICHECH